MILSGEPVNAQTALEYGLVDELVESHADLAPAAQKLLGKFTTKSRRALAIAKRSVHLGGELTLGQALDLESELFGLSWSTLDRTEGISAYMEKRRPNWPD
jgi:enoyl-CoA hydratase